MIGVCAMLLSAPAQAEEEELNQASKKVYEEALTAANKSDWALCRTRAIGVWQQIKSPSVAGILGICEAELGMNRDAAEHLDFFLKNQKKGTPKQLAQVSEAFDKVKPKVARITLTPVPDDADVFLDDKPLGRGKQTFFVNPGDVRVGVAKNGQAKNKTISVKAGEQLDNLVIDVPIDSAAGGQAGVGGATGGTGGAAGQGAALQAETALHVGLRLDWPRREVQRVHIHSVREPLVEGVLAVPRVAAGLPELASLAADRHVHVPHGACCP